MGKTKIAINFAKIFTSRCSQASNLIGLACAQTQYSEEERIGYARAGSTHLLEQPSSLKY